MEIWQFLALTGVGVAAGWINVLAGGGSMLTIPALLFLGDMEGQENVANGTNRIAILAQNIVAVGTFFKSGFSDFRLSLTLGIMAAIGAIGGAYVGTELTGVWFQRFLAAVMVGVMIIMLTGKKNASAAEDSVQTESTHPKNMLWGHLAMIGAGFWGGMIQVGVGFILMPILSRIMGFDLVRTNMHKVFIVLCYTVVALSVFASQLTLVWMAGAALAIGNATGGWLGANTSIRSGDKLIRIVLFGAITALIIKLLFF